MSVARVRHRSTAVGLFLLLSAGFVPASDVYVIRFFAGVWPTGVPCEGYFWQDKLMFHNSTTTEQKVRLLGVSSSLPRPDARDLVLPPGASVSVTQDFASGGRQETSLNWFPLVAFEPLLFVNHLDVPAGIIVASRIESHQSGSLCTAFPTYSNTSFGLLALPVHRFLTPAGTRQYHLGTDLGSDGLGLTNPSHTNVGIYNGGPAAANATIELRRSCDDGLITSRTVRVPENSVVQTAGPINDVSGYGPGCAIGILPQIYTVVTVDQPSFSYAVTLSNEIPPKIPISVSGVSN